MTVYLCGAMEGLSQEEASMWRETATTFLATRGIKVKDPTRRKKFHDEPYSVNLAKKIVKLDLLDIEASTVVLANLKDRGKGKAWGSVCEVALAYKENKPVITVLEKGFHHPFIETFSTEVHHTLDAALEATLAYYR